MSTLVPGAMSTMSTPVPDAMSAPGPGVGCIQSLVAYVPCPWNCVYPCSWCYVHPFSCCHVYPTSWCYGCKEEELLGCQTGGKGLLDSAPFSNSSGCGFTLALSLPQIPLLKNWSWNGLPLKILHFTSLQLAAVCTQRLFKTTDTIRPHTYFHFF